MINWSEFVQLEWTHPLWALLALQPLLMVLLLKLRRNQVLHYADVHLLAWVVRGNVQGGRDRWTPYLGMAAWLLLACAAAGPRLPLPGDSSQAAVPRHEMDIMVLLDVSPSMQAQDVSPQRLQRARLELLDLLPRLRGERLGLIAFSGSAGMLMPLSRDYAAMSYYLKLAEPALFDTPGTAMASAVDLALRKLAQHNSDSRAILLLTDAEASALSGPAGAALWDAAGKLKEAGIRLYILGTGTAEGTTIPQSNGYPLVNEGVEVISSMDQSGFTELAQKTGGKFTQVEDGDGDWRSLYDHGLLSLPGDRQSADNIQAWQELYAIFLLPAIFLFGFIYFPFGLKKIQPAALLALTAILLVLFSSEDTYAAETEAYEVYKNQNYSQAQTAYAAVAGYAGRMGEGAAAYRRKDYQYAIRQFSAALLESNSIQQREKALYNLGNSYFLAGAYRIAADAFMGVLSYAPENKDARANLALAAGKLAGMNKPGKNQQGIAGRRGRETGATPVEETADSLLSLEAEDDKKKTPLHHGSEISGGDKASLQASEKQRAAISTGSLAENEMAYRAALKKLELATDNPLTLHKALIKIEAARAYVPLPEMMPW